MPEPSTAIRPPRSLASARGVFAAFVALLALYLAVRFGPVWYAKPDTRIPGDFHVYWVAAERLGADATIYVPSDPSPYKYSPTFAFLFRATFFRLDEKLAAAIWMTLSVLAFFGAFLAFGWRLLRLATLPLFTVGGIVLTVGLAWRGFFETLAYGQIDLLIGSALMVLLALATEPRRENFDRATRVRGAAIRAFLWASVLIVKPHLALAFVPAFFAYGMREGARVMAATLALYLVPVFWLGPAGLGTLFADWIECLRVQQDAAFLTGAINQGLGAVLARLAGRPAWVGSLSIVGVALDLALVAWFGWKMRRDARGEPSPEGKAQLLAFGILGYVLFSPLSWRWFIFLWVPVNAVALATLDRREAIRPALARFAPWMIFAFLTTGVAARAFGWETTDIASRYGLYAAATACLFAVFAARAARLRPTDPIVGNSADL